MTYLLVELSFEHACDSGTTRSTMLKRSRLFSSFFHILGLIDIQSIKIKPSLFGYIAMSLALVGNGEKHKAYRACDIAFQHCHSSHVPFLLLLKVSVMWSRTWLSLRR